MTVKLRARRHLLMKDVLDGAEIHEIHCNSHHIRLSDVWTHFAEKGDNRKQPEPNERGW